MMEFVRYFHKNSVTSCREIKKDSDKEDCDNRKKIVIIEKNFYNRKIHACNKINLLVI